VRQKRRSYRESDDVDDGIGEDLAAVNDRLDALTRQLERMAQVNTAPPPAPAPPPPPRHEERADRVSDALARLDRRLDQVIAEGRAVASEQRSRYVPPPPPAPPPPQPPAYAPPQQPMQQAQAYAAPPQAPPSRGPANWAAQISARQRALDGGPAAPAPQPTQAPPQPARAPVPQAAWLPGPDLSGLEHQIHHLNTQISALHQPYENALTALRGDLAEIGRALTEAMPRRAIEALEGEIRSLAERVDRTRQAGADGAALGALERELAEVRQALHGLTPAESLAGFEDAVRGLYHKLDEIAASGASAQGDPMAFKQLEQAVVSLRGVVSNVASDGALAQLAAEVRGLGAQFERATHESSNEALGRLEARIGALMESGRAVPPELEGSIRALSERLDRMQLSQGDQLAFEALEDRIAKLSEKLDASDARFNRFDAIERGLADLLVYLEEMRSGSGTRGLRAPPSEPAPVPTAPPLTPTPEAPAAAPLPAPVMVQPPPAIAQSPLEMIPDAPFPAPQQRAPLAPRAAPVEIEPPPQPKPMPRGPQRRPIDPHLPPDTPLEPGSGQPRLKPGSAAARIAASEAALANVRSLAGETGGKSAAIAAARNAAKAAYLDAPVRGQKPIEGAPRKWLKWPFKRADKHAVPEPQVQAPPLAPALPPVPVPPPMPSTMPRPLVADDAAEAPVSRGRRILKILKTLLIAASVAIIVVGVAQTAMDFLFPDSPTAPETLPPKDQSQNPSEAPAPAPRPARPMPAPGGEPETTQSIGRTSSFFDPNTVIKLPEVTGSIPRKPAPVKPATPAAPAGQPRVDALPASLSPALRTAAAAGNAAAEYEVGARYAEGRGVPLSPAEAAVWLQRAADAGFAPAQFRLASLNEKGEGVRKDTQAARRLYLAAANQGHAKAMHNLAVLHAEGIDGKPDYKAAFEWFRKAATYGVTDSQYNLAILYARGIGVPVNLAESYRWFAHAAQSGDREAARKRDEVAARLDQQTLAAAKHAVQSVVPEREPEEAVNLKAPPGGWDHTPAAPAKPRRPAT
jgi:localization factor PodJL